MKLKAFLATALVLTASSSFAGDVTISKSITGGISCERIGAADPTKEYFSVKKLSVFTIGDKAPAPELDLPQTLRLSALIVTESTDGMNIRIYNTDHVKSFENDVEGVTIKNTLSYVESKMSKFPGQGKIANENQLSSTTITVTGAVKYANGTHAKAGSEVLSLKFKKIEVLPLLKDGKPVTFKNSTGGESVVFVSQVKAEESYKYKCKNVIGIF